jgi:hypothetical protein
VGAVETGRLVGEQEAGTPVVEGGGPEGARKQRKRLRLAEGGSENGCRRKRAGHRDHVWSYDFVMDRTEDGRRLKMMPVVDEHTRECLAIEVERSITAEDVIGTPWLACSANGVLRRSSARTTAPNS